MSPAHGRVVDFDDHKGYGYIESADGRRLFFHCTAIADGSRTIAVGIDVSFEVVEGRMGTEATAVRPPE